ncbi:MAG: DUF1559 domain-containing protein [Pirellulaceae bacterium]|nr:DUF1559 domain-containing protein [Planctomycetales bacterium]
MQSRTKLELRRRPPRTSNHVLPSIGPSTTLLLARRPQSRSAQFGFTVVELLVVIAIVGMRIALLLPAVNEARETARKTHCHNSIWQLGIATITYQETFGYFPPARLRSREWYQTECETSQPSWFARILDYFDCASVGSQWNYNATYEEHPAELREFAPEVFVCPSRRSLAQSIISSGEVTQTIVYPCGCMGFETVWLSSGVTGDYAGNHGDLTAFARIAGVARWPVAELHVACWTNAVASS